MCWPPGKSRIIKTVARYGWGRCGCRLEIIEGKRAAPGVPAISSPLGSPIPSSLPLYVLAQHPIKFVFGSPQRAMPLLLELDIHDLGDGGPHLDLTSSRAVNSCDVLPMVLPDSAVIRALKSSVAAMRRTSGSSFLMMDIGVPAGASRPNHELART